MSLSLSLPNAHNTHTVAHQSQNVDLFVCPVFPPVGVEEFQSYTRGVGSILNSDLFGFSRLKAHAFTIKCPCPSCFQKNTRKTVKKKKTGRGLSTASVDF